MKKTLLIAVLAFSSAAVFAQNKYFTRNGKVSFDASSPLEKIEAYNDKATSVLDYSTGQIEFGVLMKAFLFERALMQEHFNENYVESDQYPKATFKGIVAAIKTIDLAKDGVYPMKVTGQLTLHGVTRDVTADAVFTVKGGALSATADFNIAPGDYNIAIPSLVKDKIANNIRIQVQSAYQVFKAS